MIRSTQKHHRAAWTALATAGALCMALTLAPAAAAQDVIDVRAGSTAIDFEPTVAHGGLVLTVSGPDGFYHREEFGAGESASFSIFDQDGGALPDGSYTWELTAAPTDVQRREALEANRLESRSQTQGITPVVESGSFAVIGGSLVAGGAQEPGAEQPATAAPEGSNTLATKDFVINDDLIVTSSQCLGFDCANGESFGFDTLRMKENNLRIKFEDTSTASGFPTNDWELVANDSASGGLSRFSIRDVDASRNLFTVEAGAPNNALYVESSGDVGIGTSNPVLDLHVSTGDTPALRLEQNTSSGFAAQIFDIASNEANFFVRDVTGGSRLPFRIRPGAPTSSIDIGANGNVGVGTASPSGNVHVKAGSDEVLFADSGGVGIGTSSPAQDFEVADRGDVNDNTAIRMATISHAWDFSTNENTGNFRISKLGTGTSEFDLTASGDLTIAGDIFTSSCSPCTSDYVFDPNYELMPLDQLHSFIEKNGHLPNVPSEQEYQARGRVGLHDFQVRLLEKIEELTLHTIRQQETIEDLQAKLELLADDKNRTNETVKK